MISSYSSLASDIIRGRWLLDRPEAYFPAAMALLARNWSGKTEALSLPERCEVRLESGGYESDGAPSKVEKKVAIIPLHGVMTKYETCYSYGTAYLAEKMRKYAAKDDVIAIVLDIDSGGGAANSVPPMCEAIEAVKAAGKPVIAHGDFCASAALWVASQCDLIYLDNEMSEIGSIGAVCTLQLPPETDPSTGVKTVQIYAKESPDKNKSYRKAVEGDYSLLQDELSPLVRQFQDAVRKGRPGLDVSVEGVMTGAVFPCDRAISIGLADARKTLTETVEAAFALAEV